ncbi:MAG: FKBP-type peptidyl-prolyl cis-trans isomerase, partial [Candidatus Omnitrophica bacterium]|nr:FKBP-type peptidyl-prolyl cis-trans isomerase [Candidatus Omnitrophota bacterium]
MTIAGVTKLQAADVKIEDGKTVKFEYALKIDGELVESSEGKEPLEYKHGAGIIIPGL